MEECNLIKITVNLESSASLFHLLCNPVGLNLPGLGCSCLRRLCSQCSPRGCNLAGKVISTTSVQLHVSQVSWNICPSEAKGLLVLNSFNALLSAGRDLTEPMYLLSDYLTVSSVFDISRYFQLPSSVYSKSKSIFPP